MRKIVIPIEAGSDQRVWCTSDTGNLTFKEAYRFLYPSSNALNWCKLIWKHFIPPSKSFVVWRLMHKKMPTDDNLRTRGCVTVSICPLCYAAEESTDHIFLSCGFANSLWCWLNNALNCVINKTSIARLFDVCNRYKSCQCR